ncbi:MAG: hypothetical protein HQM16_01880 [Deltaproteobacteria bacterium]|nr:hypothetical protein [Deltaproteobacteria bacterium]
MNILIYSQYLFGLGHMVRAVVLATALAEKHGVYLINAGYSTQALIPHHGYNVKDLYTGKSPSDLGNLYHENLLHTRIIQLCDITHDVAPDVILIEAYPFARRKFKSEVIPFLKFVRKKYPHCQICSSVRDVLLKYGGDEAHRNFVITELNKRFDRLFIHSDPNYIRLDQTFGSLSPIKCRVEYTGFVCRGPDADIQRKSWHDGGSIVVSYGGSIVGNEIIEATLHCHQKFFGHRELHIFTNPTHTHNHGYIKNVHFHGFDWDYINFLGSAAVSVSMGGYNSVIEAIRCKTPSVIVPYNQNNEQDIRLELLRDSGLFEVIAGDKLNPATLKIAIEKVVNKQPCQDKINLDGAGYIKREL